MSNTLMGRIEDSSTVLRSNTVFLDSSMVEHTAVNRGVVGSSPTRGVRQSGIMCSASGGSKAGRSRTEAAVRKTWLHGQAVKTSPFHGGNTGSIPVGVIDMIAVDVNMLYELYN